jgi:beta-glucosidase
MNGEQNGMLAFPPTFVWGAATSSYQIEGAAQTDGRGVSIWDTFSRTPGKVLGGDTGDVAIDHYRRYRDDIALMAGLGLEAYRFSIAWPRIQPTGSGPADQRGLDFYQRLVDALLEAGIQPWVTLYHWDLPQALEDAGGWPNRDTAQRFVDYAAIVHDALGDRVRAWTTINEPWCAAFLGYASGDHAPGRHDPAASIQAAHHLLLGHGQAVQEMRGQRPGNRFGIALNLYAVSAAADTEADHDAARRIDGLQNRFFLDAIHHGSYPIDVLRDLEPYLDISGAMDCVRDGDMEAISTRLDLLGVNYYTRHTVSGQRELGGEAISSPFASASPWPGSEHVSFVAAGLPVTDMGWEIDPSGLREILTRVSTEYPRLPIYIMENGAAFPDKSTPDGVHDPERLGYLGQHLQACHEAIESGVPLEGYFAWSLMDNYEWSWGYSKRFGLVYVDFETQRRIPKSSALWYSSVIRQGGVHAPME